MTPSNQQGSGVSDSATDTTASAAVGEETPSNGSLTEAERLRLRAQVTLAAEAVPLNWPMRTFISRSPLMGFEHLPFDEAVEQARGLFGGEGYLSIPEYRAAHLAGRITSRDLSEVLRRLDPELGSLAPVHLDHRTIHAEQVVLLHLVHGIDRLSPRSLAWAIDHDQATRRLRPDTPESTQRHLMSQSVERVHYAQESVGRPLTIADWVLRVSGLDLPATILDAIGNRDPSAHTNADPFEADTDLDHLVRTLGLPADRRAGYVSCVEQRYEALEASHPARCDSAREFVARWIEQERRFLGKDALRYFGVSGRFAAVSREVERHPLAYYVQSLWHAAQHLMEQAHRDAAWTEGSRHAGRQGSPINDGGRLQRSAERLTASDLLDRLTDSDLVATLNDQLVKWVSAFVDEGMADWPMPSRHKGFYEAWREVAPRDASLWTLGIAAGARKIQSLPPEPEDALVSLLRRLGVPDEQWPDYLRRQLGALPGWAGYIRWRSQNPDYPDQSHHPIDPVDYLVVRLFYEVELAENCLLQIPDSSSTDGPVLTTLDRLSSQGLARSEAHEPDEDILLCSHTWRLFHLAQLLELAPEALRQLRVDDAKTLLDWLDRFPHDAMRRLWHEAYEWHYRQELLAKVADGAATRDPAAAPRPRGQAVFCIDVRSETFRRHLEAQGGYETIGFAGFFAVPLCYRSLGGEEDLLLCPVLIKPKHRVSEGPRLGQDRLMQARLIGDRWHEAGEHLLHEMKASPPASHQTIDLLAIPFGLLLAGKTLAVDTYRRMRDWLRRWLRPPVPTRIPTEKFSHEQGDAIVAVGERALIAEVIQRRFPRVIRDQGLPPTVVEEFRLAAVKRQPRGVADRPAATRETKASELLGLSVEDEQELLRELRVEYGINAVSRQAQLDRLSARGFTPKEQAFVVETSLRLMSLTANYARLVLICGHGSTTENNPYASALDCGACGGNHGGPNARVLASMANKAEVRGELRTRGIDIPDDTRFLAGQHDTTTDRVTLFDLEELPETHRPDWLQLQWDLQAAGLQTARERCRRLPGAPRRGPLRAAARHARRRSAAWAQVRPEWGLSNNAAFIIARRAVTVQANLEGRTFLHNYDAAADETGKVLETIMTAPLVVAEWINLQYYFSGVDPWAYGSGSKVIHNVVAGMGVMLGRHSDLQTGLPLQTVNDGLRHYHEPQRLLAVIEAGLDRLAGIISRHEILQRFFNNRWVHLVALDPSTGALAQYEPGGTWTPVSPMGVRERGRS